MSSANTVHTVCEFIHFLLLVSVATLIRGGHRELLKQWTPCVLRDNHRAVRSSSISACQRDGLTVACVTKLYLLKRLFIE